MNEKKILIVDDEARIRELIRQYLEFEGYLCEEAENGQAAVDAYFANRHDLIIMDIMMPVMDGLEAMRTIRKTADVPILLLTAKGEEYDKVMGFDFGADDYVVKPFSPRELTARVRAMFKRMTPRAAAPETVYRFGELSVNFSAYEVRIGEQKLDLTPKEFELLCYFIKNKGVVLNRETLLNQIWGYQFAADTRTVDTHIKMLRNNLGSYRELIKTVWGVGYRYDET